MPNFTMAEMVRSNTALRKGIDNTPPANIAGRLVFTMQMMEMVRSRLGDKPIHVSSGYRSPELNKSVGGSAKSAHCEGYAVDFTCPEFGTPLEVCKALQDAPFMFDTLIYEGNWVHISFAPAGRKQVLTAHFKGGEVSYSNGLEVESA